MEYRKVLILWLILIGIVLSACSSEMNAVPSLDATPMPDNTGSEQDDEALVMAFAECLRGEGMEVTDPTVDADGNILLPELAEGASATRDDWKSAYEVCGGIIENISISKKKVDRSAQLETYIEIATCMQDRGFDIEEPTAESLETWVSDLKNTFEWDDPDAQEAFESCSGRDFSGNSKDGGNGK